MLCNTLYQNYITFYSQSSWTKKWLWTITVHLLKIRPSRLMPESVLSLPHDLLRPFKKIPPSLLVSISYRSRLFFFLPRSVVWDLRTPLSCAVCSSDLQKRVVAFSFIIHDLQNDVALGCTQLAVLGLHMAFPTASVCPSVPPGFFFSLVLEERWQLSWMNRGEGEVSCHHVTTFSKRSRKILITFCLL